MSALPQTLQAARRIWTAIFLLWAVGFWGNEMLAQSIELNLRVKPGTPSEQFLRTRSGDVPAALLRDTRAVPHMQACTRVQALAQPRDPRAGKAIAALYTLRFDSSDIQAQIAALLATDQFEWVEENRLRRLHLPPIDSSDDARVGEQWYHEYVQTFAAWDSTRGRGDIAIGVLDTGIDYGHPEFDGQIALNAAEDRNGNGRFDPWPDTVAVAGVLGDFDGLDQDGNGYADDVIGFDFTDQPRSPFGGDYLFPDPDPLDDNDHGTLVSGIIAAKADNQYGGTGIAPGCRIKVLRAFSGNGSGEDDDIARAIIYAADNGIPILNLSFGDIYPSQMMHAAIQYAYAKGVVMVASSGNGTGDNLHYPSSFDEVISVGASALSFDGTTEILWPLSSFGHTLSLVAPGSGILCPTVRDTSADSDFDFFSGTSTAAPMVSAAVGLLFSQRGICSPQQVRGILTSTTDDISEPGWDHYTGAGRLNILRALQNVGASNVQILNPVNDSGSSGDSLWVVVTALDPQGQSIFLEYQNGAEGQGAWQSILSSREDQIFADTLALWEVGNLPEGEYTLRLRVEKTNGSTAEDRVRVVLDRTAPQIAMRYAVPAWDNEVRKLMFVYRANDRSLARLEMRPLGASTWNTHVHDRITRHGAFLIGPDQIGSGDYEYRLTCTNETGISSSSPLDTIHFDAEYAPLHGYDPTGLSMPMGHYLGETADFDADGLKEIVMSEYTPSLSFGKLRNYEYNAVGFTAVDSLDFKPILIPKSVADADGDGLQELLCSVNDSMYVVEQGNTLDFPAIIQYQNLGNGLYPAQFADVDDDGSLELLAKDQVDYKVLERNGSSYSVAATLLDASPDYVASVAPRALVGDFDGDGNTETAFGDFDGDLILHERTASGYALRFVDSTELTQSASYVTQGDFDGDGRLEIFIAAHSPLNRNEVDFEYEPPFWHLRIFKSAADNSYQVVWEDFLYDIDTEDYNAATAANLDLDLADELIFTTFPRTYIVEWDGSDYGIDWFHYGALCTHHFAADFDGDGLNEFALGRGDTAFFWQKDAAYLGPEPVAHLEGRVLDSARTELQWSPSANATDYRIWRGDYNGPGSVQIALVDSSAGLSYVDVGLTPGQTYLYVLESKNLSLNPVYSPFSYAILLRAHGPGRLDSAQAIDAHQVKLHFNVPIALEDNAHDFFLLDSLHSPIAVVSGVDGSMDVVLAFADPIAEGTHRVDVAPSFLDAERGFLAVNGRSASFVYTAPSTDYAYFTRWEIAAPQAAIIHFNASMDAVVLEPGRWSVAPYGTVTGVEWTDASQDAVRVLLQDCALGALGYPLSITLGSGQSLEGAPMREKEGNTATFSENKPDLTEVYVYPNPYRIHDLYPGIRFANLTRQATIQVLSASGQKVISLEESDGDGGLDWNLMDAWGERVKPGVYLYKVEAPDQEPFLGKFSILE